MQGFPLCVVMMTLILIGSFWLCNGCSIAMLGVYCSCFI